jgi:hypothetical protein
MRTGTFMIEMSERCRQCPYKELELSKYSNVVDGKKVGVHYEIECVHKNVCEYYIMNYCGEGGDDE